MSGNRELFWDLAIGLLVCALLFGLISVCMWIGYEDGVHRCAEQTEVQP